MISVGYAEIWDGPQIVFTKPAFADWTLPENQDWITDSVAITRADTRGIFNIAQEESYNSISPIDTEWAYGTTDDVSQLTFSPWVDWGVSPGGGFFLNRPAVLHLISDDIYIDIFFTQWGAGMEGGGQFSYTRSTRPVPEPTGSFVLACVFGLMIYCKRRQAT
jgi:hypothetical protein